VSTTFKGHEPATGAEGPEFTEATAEEVTAAVARATQAARDPRLADPARRVVLLRTSASRLRARADELVAVCERETGLPAVPRLRGELERTCRQLEAFATVVEEGSYVGAIIDPPDPDAKPIPRPDLRRMLRPIGPVAVFGASNFPLAFSTAGGDTASALAAGCPVVVKGHPFHPATGAIVAEELAAAVAEAGLPEGTFGHLPASGIAVGEALVDEPGIKAVAFTGSTGAGRALMDRAAARPEPIPVFAEMGSLNPLVVTPGALAERGEAIATGLVASVATFGGQLCTKPGLAFVPAGPEGDAFAATVAAAVDARPAEVLLGAGVLERFQAGLADLEHAERLTADRPADDAPGFRAAPVVLQAAAPDLDGGLLEEHFGPAVVLVRYGSLEEAQDALEGLGGQLTLTLHAEAGEADAVAPLLATGQELAGRVLFNGFPTGVAVTWAMQHGGPWPASSAPHTSVGMTAMERFLRPVTLQDAPAALLPEALRDGNPLGIWRRVDGVMGKE
jgi:acyl-CoA reductase-like NAD-dependent aldehyde dehydrogenase